MQNIVIIDAIRDGYGVEQINNTMSVGELIACLQEFDENAKVYLSHDNGYTYGGITERRIEDAQFDEETEEIIR